MAFTTVTLRHEQKTVSNIDIEHESKLPPKVGNLEHVSLVDFEKIPWFLVSHGPFKVFSSDDDTSEFFKTNLAAVAVTEPHIGILSKSQDPQTYVVFFFQDMSIRCFCIDFSTLERLSTASSSFETDTVDNVFYSALRPRSDTSVFDRVLESKSSRRNQYVAPKTTPSDTTTQLSVTPLNGDQIVQAVNRMTLSGLRLRGLNPSSGLTLSKDRVVIKELYHMTRKLALFALRKFNYGFNGATGQEVRLSDVQDVVERLLQAYADVEPPA